MMPKQALNIESARLLEILSLVENAPYVGLSHLLTPCDVDISKSAHSSADDSCNLFNVWRSRQD